MHRTSREILDELLVLRCQQRDVAAWDELVEGWSDRLFYYLRRLLDDEQDATNALQDVWLHAIRGIPTLTDGSRLAPWLYTIARRTAMTHYRQRYARMEESAPDVIVNESDDAADQEVHLENAELVHYGLGQLDLPQREVLTLFFLEDLTTKEIAELLGIPVGTVKSRLFKARRDLRSVLERESQCHER